MVFCLISLGSWGKKGEKAGDIGNIKRFKVDRLWKIIGLMELYWNINTFHLEVRRILAFIRIET